MEAQATTTHAVRITALRKADYKDLQQLLEKPMEDACHVDEGQTWISHQGERPDGFCPTAWETLQWFVAELAAGRGGFYGDWMKNPGSALISCNDGFRPVSFLLERIG